MTRLTPNNNPLACSLYELERMVAHSATWQGLIGETGWEAARDKISFIDDNTNPENFPRPCCVISFENLLEYRQVQFGTGNFLRPSGALWVYLAIDVPDEHKLTSGSDDTDQIDIKKNQLLYVSNVFGDFVQDLVGIAGTDQTDDNAHAASNLSTPRICLLDMARTPEAVWASLGQWWWAIISVRWGDD